MASETSWEKIEQSPGFRELVRAKRRFVLPATIFFVLYYFSLPLLVGYAPTLMSTKVLGPLNLAYLLALSEFVMAWTIAFLYLRAAAKHDAMAHRLVVDEPAPAAHQDR
jgi:uncharacterized membrane protein (DUF485 family)